MFTHMLIPLDGSVLSKQILPYAKQMAIRMGCDVTFMQVMELKLVHSYELDMVGAANMIRVARDEATHHLNDLVEEVQSDPSKSQLNASKDLIVELRIKLKQGNKPEDFSDEFPFNLKSENE